MTVALSGVTDSGRLTEAAAVYDAARSLGEFRWLWWPSGGEPEVAVGTERRCTTGGPHRFAAAADAVGDTRALHCFGFDENSSEGPWRGLPASLSVVPKLFWRSPTSTGASAVTGNLELAAALARVVERAPLAEPEGADFRVVADGGGPARFTEAVHSARTAIRAGAAEKLVLTRSVRVFGLGEPAVRGAITRLAGASPGATVFAVGEGDWDFVGATPEVLVRSCDATTVESVPMAGTVPHSAGSGTAGTLLADPKQRGEHALVSDAVHAVLRECCDSVVGPGEPVVVRAGEVSHLATPVRGRLRGDVSLLDVAGRLHPTPAVGAVPRTATGLVRELESTDRGYYTGVVGWTEDGRGELRVALRCGLIRHGVATLFAGAGIVADSDPEAELEETRWKLRPMLDALLRV